MNNESTASANMPELPREIYEPVLAHHMEVEEYLKQELTLSYVDLDGSHELQTCYGDILKTINALMDYTRMLDLVCEQWHLTGFHKAIYEYQAGKLREIAEKFQTAIGYDYAAAVEKCRKKRAKKQRSDDVGEEALALIVRRQQNAAEKKAEDAKTKQPEPTETEKSSPFQAEDRDVYTIFTFKRHAQNSLAILFPSRKIWSAAAVPPVLKVFTISAER